MEKCVMSSGGIDYPAMLADMEAKRDSLIASIANLRAFLGLSSEGNSDGSRMSANLGQGVSAASELPKGALLNKSIPEAIKLYLKSVAAKRTTREITEALQAHGVESLSSNFSGIVFTALKRLKKSREVLQFEEGWGLKAKAKAKKAKSPKPGPEQKTESVKPEPEAKPDGVAQEGVEQRLEKFVNTLLSSREGGEIASALKIKPQTAGLLLSKLAHKGRIKKFEDGKYGPTPK
jgi:hypothetical protein